MPLTAETRVAPSLGAAIFDRWKARRAERKRLRLVCRTRIELGQLDDAILRDIGLTPADVRGFDPNDHRLRWG